VRSTADTQPVSLIKTRNVLFAPSLTALCEISRHGRASCPRPPPGAPDLGDGMVKLRRVP
jgi:hypothetical protein